MVSPSIRVSIYSLHRDEYDEYSWGDYKAERLWALIEEDKQSAEG